MPVSIAAENSPRMRAIKTAVIRWRMKSGSSTGTGGIVSSDRWVLQRSVVGVMFALPGQPGSMCSLDQGVPGGGRGQEK